MWLIIILHALWASSVTASKFLLAYTTPIFLTGIRMLLAGLILIAYQYFYAHEHFARIRRNHLWLFTQLIFIGIYVSYILRFWALDSISASKSMFLFNFAPFISSLYAYFFFKEKMTKRQWAGLCIGFIGMIPLLLTTSKTEPCLSELFCISWPEIATIASVFAYSYSWVLIRTLVRDNGYPPAMINGISMFFGGFFALITAFFVEGFFPVTEFWPFAGLLTFIIIISNIICHNLYGHLLRQYSTTFLAFTSFIGSPFAALYGFLLKSEIITWHYYVSSVIVLVGLFLFYKDEIVQEGVELEI
jgi:drug/metabolite transporter (DMT)-like permease